MEEKEYEELRKDYIIYLFYRLIKILSAVFLFMYIFIDTTLHLFIDFEKILNRPLGLCAWIVGCMVFAYGYVMEKELRPKYTEFKEKYPKTDKQHKPRNKTVLERIRYYFKYKFLGGHITIGNLTIYGRNAMHWSCHLYTKKYGYICFRLPFTDNGKWYPLYLYFSPNATPWAATFMLGKKESKDDWVRSRIRYACFGHNFVMDEWNTDYQMTNYDILRAINDVVTSTKWNYQNYAKEHFTDNDNN